MRQVLGVYMKAAVKPFISNMTAVSTNGYTRYRQQPFLVASAGRRTEARSRNTRSKGYNYNHHIIYSLYTSVFGSFLELLVVDAITFSLILFSSAF